MTEIEIKTKIIKKKTVSEEFLEEKIPKLREGVTKYFLCKIAEVVNSEIDSKNNPSVRKYFNWQEVKTYSDVVSLIDKFTELIEQNKSLDVDLTNNDDILVDKIFWTDERLKEIPSYILPDLKEYTQYSKSTVKKKISRRKIKES